MKHLTAAIAHMAQHDPRLAFEALNYACTQGPAMDPTPDELADIPVHFGLTGEKMPPDLLWYHGEGDARVVIAVFPEGTTRVSIPAAGLTLVHSPHVVVGAPYYVADPTFEPLRVRGRFDDVEAYEPAGLFEALVRERILDASMSIPAFDRWLGMHGVTPAPTSPD